MGDARGGPAGHRATPAARRPGGVGDRAARRPPGRIDAVNPAVNAIIALDPDVGRARAAAVDAAIARGDDPGPLAGLVTAHKDLTETADFPTTYGSPLFAGFRPPADSLLVARMKAAGAVAVGKTNTPEFGAGSHTFNPLHGVTRNPWDLDRSAGGSSGGAAVALACRMVADRRRQRHGRLAAQPGGVEQRRRLPPDAARRAPPRPGQPVEPAGARWSDGPHGRRRRPAARRARRGAGTRDPLHRPISCRPASTRPTARCAWPGPATSAGRRWTSPGRRARRLPPDDRGARAGTSSTTSPTSAAPTTASGRCGRGSRPPARPPGSARGPASSRPRSTTRSGRGNELTAADVAAAYEHLGVLVRRSAEFFSRYDLLAGPVTQLAPFPADWEYPTEVGGRRFRRTSTGWPSATASR